MDDDGNKRNALRQPVLKGAKLRFDNAVLDCLILDFSPQGARVSVEGFTVFPESVLLELRTGSTWKAVRRWQRGTEVGLELAGFAGLNLEASARAAEHSRSLRTSGIAEIIAQLEQQRFYDYPALKAAAERLSEAAAALESLLKSAAGIR